MRSAAPDFDASNWGMNQQTKIEVGQPARIAIRHSTCPHDCPSACALDVEVIDGSSIGRVRGSKQQTYTAASSAPRSRATPSASTIRIG